MKITVEFDTEEEFKARIKNPRGGKNDDTDTAAPRAPAPIQPPLQQGAAFTPQAAAFASPPGGFPGVPAAPPVGDPAVTAIVARIAAKIDGAIAGGQPTDVVLTWFRGRCGAEAANATLDQIKQVFLPKLSMPSLDDIAKLMNA